MNNPTADKPVQHTALHLLSAASFLPFQGEDFTIHFSEDVTTAAQLHQVLELSGYTKLERKPFSVILQTNHQTTYYQQGIYKVEHCAFEPLSIFLVPLGIKGKGMQYEAVFS